MTQKVIEAPIAQEHFLQYHKYPLITDQRGSAGDCAGSGRQLSASQGVTIQILNCLTPKIEVTFCQQAQLMFWNADVADVMRVYFALRSRTSRTVWLLEDIGKPYELEPFTLGQEEMREPQYA